MALSIARSFKRLQKSSAKSATRSGSNKQQYRKFTRAASSSSSFVHAYYRSVSTVSTQLSKWWAAATAAPIAAAAFWGTSTDSKNDIESLLKDAEEFEKLSEKGANEQELLKLCTKMLNVVRGMPESELLKHPEFVPSVLAVIVSFQVAVGAPEVSDSVELLYQVARKIDAENKFPEILRIVYRADLTYQANTGQLGSAKRLLLNELELVRKMENVPSSMEQSDILFALSTLCASDGDANAQKFLQESNKIFNGITQATLSSEMENYWRMSILNQLQVAASLDEQGVGEMSKIFKTSAKTLYEGFKRIHANKTGIPDFRELEVYAKNTLQQQQQ